MPNRVRSNFDQRLTNLIRDYEEMLLAVHGKTRQPSLELMLSEQTTMSMGVYWEAFTHDLFVAYVVRNPTNCIRDFRSRVDKSLLDRFAMPGNWIRFKMPATLSVAQAEKILDPKGWNVSAISAKELRDKANQVLHSTDAQNFSLTADDAAMVDLLVCLRNYLAHRSTHSRKSLKTAISAIRSIGSNQHLAGNFTEAGNYLKTVTGPNRRRVHEIGSRLRAVAHTLAP